MGHGGGKQTEKDRCLSHAQTESTTMEEVDVLTLRIFVVSYPKILVRYYTCKKKNNSREWTWSSKESPRKFQFQRSSIFNDEYSETWLHLGLRYIAVVY